MSDRSQELVDQEVVESGAAVASYVVLPSPRSEVLSAPPVEPVAPLGTEFVQNTGNASSTANTTTLVFTIPTGRAPASGNMLVIALSHNSGGDANTLTVTDSRGGNAWSRFQATVVPGNASLVRCGVSDLRAGDTITFTWVSANTQKAAVITEWRNVPAGGVTSGSGGATSTSVDSGSRASTDTTTNTLFAAVSYAGTQTLPSAPTTGAAKENISGEWMRWHGRQTAGTDTIELYSASRESTANWQVVATLPASAAWSVAAQDYPPTWTPSLDTGGKPITGLRGPPSPIN